MERAEPHNIEIERAVIASCLLDPAVLDVVEPILPSGRWFYTPQIGTIYDAVVQLHSKGVGIDLKTVAGFLERKDQLQLIGGRAGLADVSGAVATTVNIETHAKQVAEHAMMRNVLRLCEATRSRAYEADIATVLEEIQLAVSEIHGSTTALDKTMTTAELLQKTTKFIQDAQSSTDSTDFMVPYCIPAVDRYIKQLRGQMHVLAAMSGIGKTAFGLSCMDKQIEQGQKILYLCGESSGVEIQTRLSSIHSGLPFMRLANTKMNQADMNTFSASIKRLHSLRDNYIIVGKGDMQYRMDSIRRQIHKATKQWGLIDMVYIDYLQNIYPMAGTEKSSRFEQVEQNIMELSRLFGEFNTAGVVMSQINREGAHSGKPSMSHLKYSSTIENEAHIITFLHRDEMSGGILPTKWYSGKGRLMGNFATELMFRSENTEYFGKAHRYSTDDVPEPQTPYKDN